MLEFDQENVFETYAKEVDDFGPFGKGSLDAEFAGRKFRIYCSLPEMGTDVPDEYVFRVRARMRTLLGKKELQIDQILEKRTRKHA